MTNVKLAIKIRKDLVLDQTSDVTKATVDIANPG